MSAVCVILLKATKTDDRKSRDVTAVADGKATGSSPRH
jgi:hypothetical protein